MKKLFKSIASTVMVAVMLVTFCIPAMAAEQTKQQVVVSANSTDNVKTRVGGINGNYTLSAGKIIDYLILEAPAKTVYWTVGKSGWDILVNFRLTNYTTGETRSISTYANGQRDSMTWVGEGLTAGTWTVSVIYVSSGNVNSCPVSLQFYS